ncbi:MAG: hypothetical protein QOG68_68 [Solirubrobacteraceae bacterium]|jgi:hypothetical protein|nr:hypothetical protein [Solirubrobacteraceae bacterium]
MRDALSVIPLALGWIALPILWFKFFRKGE